MTSLTLTSAGRAGAPRPTLGQWWRAERDRVWAEHDRMAAAAARSYHLQRLQLRVEQELEDYFHEVEQVGFAPRPAGDLAPRPGARVLGSAQDQGRYAAAAPARAAVQPGLGVWFGLYDHDGRWSVLVERAGRVQRLLTVASREEADAVWSVVVRHCAADRG